MKRDYEKEIVMALRKSERFDAGETAFITRELLSVKTRLYKTEYPTLLAMSFIPMATDTDPYAESITWQASDDFGAADWVSDDADDLPDVDVQTGEATPTPVKTIGAQYGWSWIQLQRSAKLRTPLTTQRADRARRSIAEKIDVALRSGYGNGKIPGFLNQSSVSIYAAAGNYNVPALTAQQIAADIDKHLLGIQTDTLGIHVPTVVALPLSTIGTLNTTPWSAAGNSDTTILEWLKAHHEGVEFRGWYALETAGAGGVKRMVVYERSNEVLEGEVPLDFTELPAQAKGLGLKIPCLARCGGTVIRLPKAVRYVDGV